MTVSTTRPAASRMICPIARRRVASGVTSISGHESTEFAHPPHGNGFSQPTKTPVRAVGSRVLRLFSRSNSRSAGRLAGQILFEPVDMIVAVDNGGVPGPGPAQT